jgi:predicted nucleotide-binding protein (sugar kinase/HSP70/actin superfamily)
MRADFLAGKEFCNNGMCSPAYFTIGTLLNFLRRLRDEDGLSVPEICRRYAFVSTGSTGPCRFGMYEAEYRNALKRAGFGDFRIIMFQQKGGLKQCDDEDGLGLNVDFAVAFVGPLLLADVFNDVASHIRPYAVDPEQAEAVLERALCHFEERLRAHTAQSFHAGLTARMLRACVPGSTPDQMQRVLDHILGKHNVEALQECARMIQDGIEVDYTRMRPVCKITGEFWAQTTEGDGNYRMFDFLEAQGAELYLEPLMTWVNYLCDVARVRLDDRQGLYHAPTIAGRIRGFFSYWKKRFLFRLAHEVVNREYKRLINALGGTAHPQVSQTLFREIAHPFLNTRFSGGEGHLEVAKTIYYTQESLAHLVVSLKPFGCLPSTQSDGAQAAVLSQYPEIIYIPIETSGEGEANAYSRVLMALGEARSRARAEFDRCVALTGHTLEEIRAYCVAHPDLRRPFQQIPRYPGVAGRAANFVVYVATLMSGSPESRTGDAS